MDSVPAVETFSVGVTGGIGSGKTLVSDMFAARGAAIVDTDQIAHRLTAPGGAAIPAIQEAFGEAFFTPAGAVDRSKMRDHVFADPVARKRLEAILHPLILLETERMAEQAQGLYLMCVVPLLVETGGWQNRVSRILVVDCPEQQQIARIMKRNRFSETEVRAIMATQASREQRLAAADDIIVNNADLSTLAPQVDRLHALYADLAAAIGPRQSQHL
jgi:dephospho-CoA kinase